ncbi:hypothetical protein HR060_05365 [Catenovulum sp. SM1970]|uniref:hypothetical protein n=1 Tax=Marinifaba aquimaris TaxID=2741323 RepID=UPI0015737726|nr:hypothetical protein [Marinifaba aquimaris]NTS76292.1 hypothetical protein [Marinifaba aquimaris]
MSVNFEQVLANILDSAASAFGDGWDSIKTYAPAEFKKISSQIVEIAENVAKYQLNDNEGYSAQTGKLLLQMQRNATEGVLVAVSTLTLIAVQNAINAIFASLRETFNDALGAIL